MCPNWSQPPNSSSTTWCGDRRGTSHPRRDPWGLKAPGASGVGDRGIVDALPGPHYGSPALPQALVDWSQLISAVLSLVALVVALAAIVKSNRDIVRERRTTHELDILRGIAESLKT